MLIRKAHSQDLPAISGLLKECGLPFLGLKPEQLDTFWTAWSGKTLIGSAGILVDGSVGIGHSLAVLPGFRGLGLGRSLVAALFEASRDLGLENVYLHGGNAEFYFRALGFAVADPTEIPPGILNALSALLGFAENKRILYHPAYRGGQNPIEIPGLALLA